MKKLIIIIAIVFGMSIGSFAQNRGLFGYGEAKESASYREGVGSPSLLNLPGTHGETDDQGAPLGSGALLLICCGAAYALIKQRKDE